MTAIYRGTLRPNGSGLLAGELRDQTGYRIPLVATVVREGGKPVRIDLSGSGEMPTALLLPDEPGFVPNATPQPEWKPPERPVRRRRR